jgi:hypothetical protein
MKIYDAALIIATVSFASLGGAALAETYPKIVQQNCQVDYKKYCGDYGLETAALRSCMDRNGKSLSKACVSALVKTGYVSEAEVNRRKKVSR